MPTFRLNKLVRTGLPQMYEELGQKAELKELEGEELRRALLQKLQEEIGELTATGGGELKELADLLQVIQDMAIASGSTPEELERLRDQREKDRGPMVKIGNEGKPKGFYVAWITCEDDDPWTAYYRKEPERFPEE